MTEVEGVDVVSVTGYNVSVVDEPSGPTVVIVMASSVLIGKLVIDVSVEEESVDVGRTLSVEGSVVVTVVVSEVVLTKVVVFSVVLVLTTVVVVGLK